MEMKTEDARGVLSGKRRRIQDVWWENIERKESAERKAQRNEEWRRKVVRDVREWGAQRDRGKWGYEDPREEEVERVLREVKNKDGGPGKDMIRYRMITEGGKPVVRKVTKLLVEVWREERKPRGLEVELVVPMYKRGDRFKTKAYRPLCLVGTIAKITGDNTQQDRGQGRNEEERGETVDQ
jgi:hypothetical protein